MNCTVTTSVAVAIHSGYFDRNRTQGKGCETVRSPGGNSPEHTSLGVALRCQEYRSAGPQPPLPAGLLSSAGVPFRGALSPNPYNVFNRWVSATAGYSEAESVLPFGSFIPSEARNIGWT